MCNSGGLPPGCVPIGELPPGTECPVNGYDPSNFLRRQANNPNTDVCRLLPSDFAPLANLTDPPQLHAEDPGTSAASGPFTGLYVLAFLPTDDPVEFRTSAGGFVQVEDSPGPFALHDSTYMCNGQFEDCDGDGQSFKYMIAVPLGGYGATPGPARITVSQGQKNASLDFTVVGEPDSVQIDAYSTTIQNGVVDIDPPGHPNHGKLSGPDECPIPLTEAAILIALTQPDRTVLIGRVRDAAGTPITQAWLYWSGTGQTANPPTIGAVGHLGSQIISDVRSRELRHRRAASAVRNDRDRHGAGNS